MEREEQLKTQIFRAVAVTAAVLLCLIVLRKLGVIAIEPDVPAANLIEITSEV